MSKYTHHLPAILKPSEVAELFGVDSKTVARWEKSNKITSFRTPGLHRRYRREDVEALLNQGKTEDVSDNHSD